MRLGVTDRSFGGRGRRATLRVHMSAKAERIEELMSKAHAALKRAEWFEAERLTAAALQTAHSARAFGEMARIVLPLLESRC